MRKYIDLMKIKRKKWERIQAIQALEFLKADMQNPETDNL